MHRGKLARHRKEGNLEKVSNHSSLEAPNTSCSCENGSPNPPAPLEEEGTSSLEITLHRACDHSVTSSLWTTAGVQVPTELWYFWTDSGSSFPNLWQLKELDRKNGLTADEMWTWLLLEWALITFKGSQENWMLQWFFTSFSEQMHCEPPHKIPLLNSYLPALWKCFFLGRSNTP